jgi:hypothetical protein
MIQSLCNCTRFQVWLPFANPNKVVLFDYFPIHFHRFRTDDFDVVFVLHQPSGEILLIETELVLFSGRLVNVDD